MNDDREDGFDEQPSRYVIGIDLGTTNCAVAYWDTLQSSRIENFPIEQWVDFGTLEKRDLLPSFLYEPLPEEGKTLAGNGSARTRSSQSLRIVGSLARDRGLQLPGRQISSAKSWLCHDGVDRRSPILPWQADEGIEQISPVEASALCLAQIRSAWEKAHPAYPLSEQDIVLTLPASFDQVARQLTIEAAAIAGLSRVLPIEEPQAAFYAWLARHADNWEELVRPGQTILVCDIGGGTTDFTLIRVREASNTVVNAQLAETLDEKTRRKLSLHRVAVGQHLILGGDNIDLALAKFAEQKLFANQPSTQGRTEPEKTLPPRGWDALRQACRVAKETLLGQHPPEVYTIHLPGSGSRLIGGGHQIEISRDEVRACVLDGFFPHCGLNDRPLLALSGFREFGLPYARDPAMTRHLSAFLWDHRRDGRTDDEASLSNLAAARPDWVLFNGGVMTSVQLCQRITSVVGSWFAGQEGIPEDWQPQLLDGESLDLAVARGATYFGQVRRGAGVEIEAKLACAYYIQTANNPPLAVCIVPGSASPGERFNLSEQPMELSVGQPVQFPIVYSTTRLSDRVGQCVTIDDEHFAVLPPMRTVIEMSGSRKKAALPVYVEVELSQIGTLQIYCHASAGEQRWKLEFDVRGSTQTDHTSLEATANHAGILDEQAAHVAREALIEVFGAQRTLAPSQLMPILADRLSLRRGDWPPSLLRAMWAALIELQAGRGQSAEHESRWLNLLGYTLRPGFGLAADDWRVAETWRTVYGKLAFASASSRNESLILWRRIAGGFTAGQQLTVYQQVAGPLRHVLDPAKRGKGGFAISPHDLVELLRLVASLELLAKSEKTQLGDWLVSLLTVKKWAACRDTTLWAIGRIGSRVPTYGPLNSVVDVEPVAAWLRKLTSGSDELPSSALSLALMLCARRVNDRYRDLPSDVRRLVIDRLEQLKASPAAIALVREGGQLDGEVANQVLGEALPLGLKLLG